MTYGTPDDYCDMFADILSDVDGTDPTVGDAIVNGFLQAVSEWKDHYTSQLNEFDRIEQRVRKALTV